MKLLRYQNFIKESKEDIDSICRKYNIRNYTINGDGSVDVDGDVLLYKEGLTELPLKFRKVSGYFDCSFNKLTSLEGSPNKVGGHFICDKNNLTSLEGAPREVGGGFYCYSNNLTSLEGTPREVGGYFSCHNNQLTSLEGSPEKVGRYFDCHNNKLTSLDGAPREVGGEFYCSGNLLISLSGISKYISGFIDCRYNKIIDVSGVKDGWRGRFYIDGNPVHEIFKLFPQKRRDEAIEHLNDYNVIRDGKVVALSALELVFYEMGLEVPEIEEIEGYQIQF